MHPNLQVPILIGSTREDLGGVGGAAVPPAPPGTPPAPPECAPTRCNKADFRGWARSLGFNAATVDRLTAVYDDNESGHPVEPVGATQWYWAMKHANSDAARACPSRRMAQWVTHSGQKAFLYYWTYVPDAPGMCGRGACHCAELPFVWHVLSGASAPPVSLFVTLSICLSLRHILSFWHNHAHARIRKHCHGPLHVTA